MIYDESILPPLFDPRFNVLFADQNFELPKGGQYICDNYCTAFIHALNLAASNIIYKKTSQFIKLYSQRRKTNLKKCFQMFKNS